MIWLKYTYDPSQREGNLKKEPPSKFAIKIFQKFKDCREISLFEIGSEVTQIRSLTLVWKQDSRRPDFGQVQVSDVGISDIHCTKLVKAITKYASILGFWVFTSFFIAYFGCTKMKMRISQLNNDAKTQKDTLCVIGLRPVTHNMFFPNVFSGFRVFTFFYSTLNGRKRNDRFGKPNEIVFGLTFFVRFIFSARLDHYICIYIYFMTILTLNALA